MPQGDDMRIRWTTAGGRTNAIDAADTVDDLKSNNNVLAFFIIGGSGDTTNTFIEAGGATNAPGRFYRVRLVP